MCKYTQKPRAMQIHLHCHVPSGGTGGLGLTGTTDGAASSAQACFLAGEGTPLIKK